MSDWVLRVVVVGVDGSDQSTRAAAVAASLARNSGATLHIVTVVRPPEGWWGVVGSPPPAEAMSSAMSKAQRSILDATVAGLDLDGVDHESSQEIGDPASELVRYCEAVDAGLLVVGRRGAGMVERLILGSVADRLARDTPCPLVIVP
jgi:nucleotide-binding universal stress UspA family protein